VNPAPLVPGPWPALLTPVMANGEFDPAGPLAMVVFLPLVGALLLGFAPRRVARALGHAAVLWTVPGALFLLAAAWFGASGHSVVGVRWLERLPGGAGLVLSIWNIVPALLVGLVAPLAMLLPEPREKTPARAGWLLVLAASTEAALLAAGPGMAIFGWTFGAWALFFLLGEADAEEEGRKATGPFVLHALACACVLAAALAPPLLPLLLLAGAIRLGVPPWHGPLARAFQVLPTGAVLLIGVGFTTTGLMAAHDGAIALARAGGPGALVAGSAAALAALWAGLLALPQDDLKRRIAGFLSAQGAVWLALLALLDPALARPAVGGWALVTLVALVALVIAYARLWAFTRTGDLRAYGGLGQVALLRSTLILLAFAAILFAPLLGAHGRGLSAISAAFVALPLAGGALALGGALGCLALGLAVYRTIRGQAAAPLPAPEMAGREWLFLVVFAGALLFLSSLGPPVGGLGSLWPVFASAETR
jgi:NADH:ubiquinone oxidoreductase subunit 4 (subunit M)